MTTETKELIDAEKKKYDLLDLTSTEFNLIVFAGAGTNELRSVSEAFTPKELRFICLGDSFLHWPASDRDALYAALKIHETPDSIQPEQIA